MDDPITYFIAIALVVFSLVIGFSLGTTMRKNQLQKEAIQHEAAYYHKETGEFTWGIKDE